MPQQPVGQQGLLQGIKSPSEGIVVEVEQEEVSFRGLGAQDNRRNSAPTQLRGGLEAFPAGDCPPPAAFQELHPGEGKKAHRGQRLLQPGQVIAPGYSKGVGVEIHPGQGNFSDDGQSSHKIEPWP